MMSRKPTLFNAFCLALVMALLVFSFAFAQTGGTSEPGMDMATETPLPALDAATPTPDYGQMPMGSGTYGMGGMGTMSGTMVPGQMQGTTCPMMSGMDMSSMSGMSGMSGMTGMGSMSGMSGTTGMTGMDMSGMTGMGNMNVMPASPGSILLGGLNPWWLLGWGLLGLLLLAILVGVVIGIVWLVRRSQPAKPVQPV